LEVYKDRALIVNTKRPELILDKIPKSKVVRTYDNGVTQVVVNWGLDEVITLSDMKVKNPPSPITRDYNFPGIHKPFDHQKVTAEFYQHIDVLIVYLKQAQAKHLLLFGQLITL
jgi:hypothetical protein